MTTWIIRYLWIEASAKHQGRHLIAEDIGHPPARAVCRHSARWLPASRWRSCARSSKLGQAGVAPKYNMQHPSQRLFRRIRGASCVEYAHGPDKRLDRRETLQIPVNVAGTHRGIYRCDPAFGGPLLRTPPGLFHFGCVPRRPERRFGLTWLSATPPFGPSVGAQTRDRVLMRPLWRSRLARAAPNVRLPSG